MKRNKFLISTDFGNWLSTSGLCSKLISKWWRFKKITQAMCIEVCSNFFCEKPCYNTYTTPCKVRIPGLIQREERWRLLLASKKQLQCESSWENSNLYRRPPSSMQRCTALYICTKPFKIKVYILTYCLIAKKWSLDLLLRTMYLEKIFPNYLEWPQIEIRGYHSLKAIFRCLFFVMRPKPWFWSDYSMYCLNVGMHISSPKHS